MGIPTGRGAWRPWAALASALVLLAFGGALLASTRFELRGHWRGLYVLRSIDGRRLVVQDDLLLGDHPRVLAGVSFTPVHRLLGTEPIALPTSPGLELTWDERQGRGYVLNRLGDGGELLTMFSRFQDDDGCSPQGLFVGGAAPDISANALAQDQSGMAFHDARGWSHVWCSVNEGLTDEGTGVTTGAARWRFLGSRVLVHEPSRVVLESQHEFELAGGTVRMDRLASFTAGDPFFQLSIKFFNIGPGPVGYTYLYGDEPWVGHFGSSEGNVGWVQGAILRDETSIDPAVHQWAGILDESSGVANFIGWEPQERPSFVYVANRAGQLAAPGVKVPLTSNEIFIGLEWRRRVLAPGEGRSIQLTIGMGRGDGRFATTSPARAEPPRSSAKDPRAGRRPAPPRPL